MPEMTVYNYFTHRLGDALRNSDKAEAIFDEEDRAYYSSAEEAPLYTHCGEASRHIIDAAFNMLVVCDPHPHVVDHILSAAKKAIDIIWYG